MQKGYLSLFLLATMLQAERFYLGIEGGYLGNYLHYDQVYTSYLSANEKRTKDLHRSTYGNGSILGIIMGNEYAFAKNKFKARSIFFGGYGNNFYKHALTEEKTALTKIYAGFGGDAIWNFKLKPKKIEFGAFFGAAIQWSLLAPSKDFKIGSRGNEISDKGRAFYFDLRLGLTTLLNDHHRFEFLTKLSSTIKIKNQTNLQFKGKEELRILNIPIEMLISYKYLF